MKRLIALMLGFAAQAVASPDGMAQNQLPTDLNEYSLQFWPRNSLRASQVVRKRTPYGWLTCQSTGRDKHRICSLR